MRKTIIAVALLVSSAASAASAAQVNLSLNESKTLEATLRQITARADEKSTTPNSPLKYDFSVGARWKMGRILRIVHSINEDADAALVNRVDDYQRAQGEQQQIATKLGARGKDGAPLPPDPVIQKQYDDLIPIVATAMDAYNRDRIELNKRQKATPVEIDLLTPDELNLGKNNISAEDIAALMPVMPDGSQPTK